MITVVGSSNTDFTIKLKRFPGVGETVVAEGYAECCGGKGANQAVCIARLGGKVSLISNIGDDFFGRRAIENLSSEGINVSTIIRDKEYPSGIAFILVDEKGRNKIAVSPGSNSFLKLKDLLRNSRCLKDSNVILVQLEIPKEAVRAAVYLGRRFGKTVILNPAPAKKVTKDVLSKVDILIPNELELEFLTGIKIKSRSNLIKASNLLLKTGVGCVIITLGEKGCFYAIKGRSRFYRARKVKAVDTTAAGDAFCGAVAFCIDRGASLTEAIEFALKVSAITVTKIGAQSSLPTLQQVEEFYH